MLNQIYGNLVGWPLTRFKNLIQCGINTGMLIFENCREYGSHGLIMRPTNCVTEALERLAC